MAFKTAVMNPLTVERSDESWAIGRGEFTPPGLSSDYISRARLLAPLERGLGERLTLVAAPAGYGKSTVLSAWARASRQPVAWLSLDETDTGLDGFLQGLVGSVQQRYPSFDRAVLNCLTLPDLPPSWFIAGELARELADLPGELVIVLDDYHLVGDSAVHAVMVGLLERQPENVRLVVSSRTEPPFRLGLLRARGQLLELRARELRFQVDEAAAFLDRAVDSKLSSEIIAAIHERTEGWAAGLRLTALALGEQPDPAAWVQRFQGGSFRSAQQFLLDEVIRRQPAETQNLLLRSSICERFCADLCDALLADPAAPRPSRAVLDELERSELMLVPLDETAVWFRYHHLFRVALQQQLASRVSAVEIRALHRRAAAWFASEGLVDEALQHLMAAGEIEQAAELVEHHRLAAVAGQGWPRLERWLNLLPAAVIARRPGLLLARAWIQHFRLQTALMIQYLEVFDQQLKSGDVQPDQAVREALLGEADLLWAQVEIRRVNGRAALERGQQALRRLPLTEGTLRSHARFPVLLAGHLLGDHAGAVRFIESELVADPSDTPRLMGGLGWIKILAGALPAAVQALCQALESSEAQGHSLLVVWAHYLLGWVAYQRNELLAARAHFLAAEQQRDIAHLLALREATLGLALTLWALGDEGARSMVEDFAQLADQTLRPADAAAARACLARLSFYAGDRPAVVDWLGSDRQLPSVLPFPEMQCPTLTRAQLLIGLGTEASLGEADGLLAARAVQFAEIKNLPGGVATQALQALLYQARGDTFAALAVLSQAIDAARPGRLVRIFIDLGPPLRDLLVALDEQADQDDSYITELLSAFQATRSSLPPGPQPEAPTPPGLVEALTWREQETLQLLDGRLSNKEIAASLAISTETVKKHTSHIYQKLQVRSRRGAVARARALGLLDA